ncbi:ArnT family glycosyltransferase [Planctellipticum variicoloris]|uniref:ArnT family glycosyltransferase n=1 Tax=Planctellipticum variicoloris TaxID=3064265 RepID=UPI002C6E1B51|nr:hypothetical protein SH412_003230 [Planctomycetaceae bacterium SH412]HTN04653.1 hypothetical protein [Planctomycetaceae bacterium]
MGFTLRRQGWLLGLLLAVALGARLVAAVAVQQKVASEPGRLCLIAGDAEGYWSLSEKLLKGQEYSLYDPPRRVMRMPGFPAVLAGLRALCGEDNLLGVRCGLAVLGTLGCGLTCWLGVVLGNARIGLIGAGLLAVSPTQIVFSVMILSESVFGTVLVASLIPIAWLLRHARSTIDARHWLAAALAGSLIAVATYMRPTWLVAGPIAAGLLLVAGSRSGTLQRLLLGGVLVASLALCLTPWTIRNWRITGHVIPTTLWMGPSLYDGWNPAATGDSEMTFFEKDQLLATMSEYDMDQEYRRRAWDWAKAHPVRVLELAGSKALRYWNVAPNAPQFKQWAVWLAVAGWSLPVLMLSVVGAWRLRADGTALAITWGPVLLFCAIHMLFVGSIRYRLPAELPLCLAAAAGLLFVCRAPQSRFSATEGTPCAAPSAG